MGFKDNFPNMNASMMASFGEAVTYAAAGGGNPLPIPAIPDFGEDLDDAQWRAALQASAELLVLESDVPEPSAGDVVTIDGIAWHVVRKLSRTGGMWRLEIRRDLRPTFRK